MVKVDCSGRQLHRSTRPRTIARRFAIHFEEVHQVFGALILHIPQVQSNLFKTSLKKDNSGTRTNFILVSIFCAVFSPRAQIFSLRIYNTSPIVRNSSIKCLFVVLSSRIISYKSRWNRQTFCSISNGRTFFNIILLSFFVCLPNDTLPLEGDKCFNRKHSKERLTLLIEANIAGSNKLKSSIIRGSKRSHCFPRINYLPANCMVNRPSRITGDFFLQIGW